MAKPSLSTSLHNTVELGLELEQRLDPAVVTHWNTKIKHGVVPTEIVEHYDGARFGHHFNSMRRLARFEKQQFLKVWARKGSSPIAQIHYFGIGLAMALKQVAAICNDAGTEVVAYDISTVGCDHGKFVFEELAEDESNRPRNCVYQADIEFACDERYISPENAGLIVIPRVLDVLDNVSGDKEKMQRTAQKLGKLLRFLDVLIIHPEPEDNKSAIFRDTKLSELDEVVAHMATGLGAKVSMERLGKTAFHGHIYTAALLGKS